MPTWLNIAIWIIMILWSLVEIQGLYHLCTRPRVYYTMASSIVSYLWVLIMILWISFNIFG